ncbi:MAG: hypothetical protein ACI8T6_000757 [Candidatus Poseidoniaceae archaeon]|jgi:hypothetical protein|tara:strand:- start:681 stop:962 length:282 start_codon:yes stop_codon:yes gene_type:complete
MGNTTEPRKEWNSGTLLWFAIVVWFSSSLLSQAAYMAFYGVPYDAVALLKGFGPLYYAVLIIEVLIWAGIGSAMMMKVARKFVPKFQSPVPSA